VINQSNEKGALAARTIEVIKQSRTTKEALRVLSFILKSYTVISLINLFYYFMAEKSSLFSLNL
jgi:hypothetical protein